MVEWVSDKSAKSFFVQKVGAGQQKKDASRRGFAQQSIQTQRGVMRMQIRMRT
jgi:hypothetical protein